MLSYIKPAAMMLLLLTLVTGVVYPFLVTVMAQTLFNSQANGSLIKNGQSQYMGSELIGQNFSLPQYFWGRPSATVPYAYNASASSGSNLGPTNPVLADAVTARIKVLQDIDPDNTSPVPIDLVTASASGLDPHISIAAAKYQINRVARVRKMGKDELEALLDAHIEGRQWGIFGEPRVNVLKLNIALEANALVKQ